MLMNPEFKLTFSRRIVTFVIFVGVNYLPLGASLVFQTPTRCSRSLIAIISVVFLLLFFYRLFNYCNEILRFVNVEEHSLNARKAIKRDIINNLIVLLDFFLKELVN